MYISQSKISLKVCGEVFGDIFGGCMFSADENNIILEYSVYTIGSSMENKIKIWSIKDGKVVKLNSNVCLKVYKVLDCIPLRTDF